MNPPSQPFSGLRHPASAVFLPRADVEILDVTKYD